MAEIHAELLEALPEDKRPHKGDCVLEHDPRYTHGFCWNYKGRRQKSRDHDARPHIELAAWRCVREWCRKQGESLVVGDGAVGVGPLIGCSGNTDPDNEMWFAQGPTDAHALLEAVKYIKDHP